MPGCPFRRILVAALVAGIMPVQAQTGDGRPAICVLEVEGRHVIDGPCRFIPFDKEGSFEIITPDRAWFAYVIVSSKGVAQGYWNGEPESRHAQNPLGTLRRTGPCWENDTARVCATAS